MDCGSSSDRRALLAAAIDRIAPRDENGAGAVELGVVGFVERALAEADEASASVWTAGLAAVDACARERHECCFAALPHEHRDAILADFERGVAGSELDDEAGFFELLRDHVLQGMFGDPVWGGNRNGRGWELLGYPGPRLVWTEAEQQLDVLPGPAPASGHGGHGG